MVLVAACGGSSWLWNVLEGATCLSQRGGGSRSCRWHLPYIDRTAASERFVLNLTDGNSPRSLSVSHLLSVNQCIEHSHRFKFMLGLEGIQVTAYTIRSPFSILRTTFFLIPPRMRVTADAVMRGTRPLCLSDSCSDSVNQLL